jgi:ATP-dependent Lhr-like helicase
VLAQHIVGMALEKKWSVKEAYRLVKRSYCYRNLPYESFEAVLKYLSGWYSSLEVYKVYGKIWYDERDGVFGRRGPLLRLIYSTNVGTIPDEVAVKVFMLDGRWVGSIEEEFLERLSPGDVFILGGQALRVQVRYRPEGLRHAEGGRQADRALLVLGDASPQLRPRRGHRKVQGGDVRARGERVQD